VARTPEGDEPMDLIDEQWLAVESLIPNGVRVNPF
jgi:hypothetical protein